MSSFNFGNTSTPGLGTTSTPTKPAGFSNFSFGGQTTGAPPAFGAQSTAVAPGGFGTAPAFGASTSFGGGQVATATPAFGFGQTSTSISTAAPAFGFGTQTTSSQAGTTPAFSFGQGGQQPTLGTSGGFGTFGSTAPAPAFGGLGASTAATGFGGGGGFSGFGGLNTTNTTTSAPMFSGFGTNTTSTTGFGVFSSFGKTTAPPAFGSSFGQSLLPQPQQQLQLQQQQQQQPQQLTADEAFANSILKVNIFGDERDAVIAKWNYLQAQWGTGKAFYSPHAPPFELQSDNYLCRFKAMGYTKMPGRDNKLGFVLLTFNKPTDQVRAQQQQVIDQLKQVFGNRPNFLISIDSIKPFTETKCQVLIYIEEKSTTSNETKRIVATETAAYLNQQIPKQQVTSMGVEQITPLVLPDEDQLKEYLDNSPKGIDPRIWKQAIHDNPDPTKLIPVPIIGFNELKWRIKCQETETDTQHQYLQKVQRDLAELKQRHANTVAKIMEHRRKFADLSHRVLQVIVKQECTRKMGVALSPEEEILRSKLENMQALVSTPTQFKGRLSELLSQMRMQRNQWNNANVNEYTLDKDASEEMKSFLTMQQKAMAFLIETVNKDMKSLKIISDGMKQLVRE